VALAAGVMEGVIQAGVMWCNPILSSARHDTDRPGSTVQHSTFSVPSQQRHGSAGVPRGVDARHAAAPVSSRLPPGGEAQSVKERTQHTIVFIKALVSAIGLQEGIWQNATKRNEMLAKQAEQARRGARTRVTLARL
jgi:hypothetical protein